MFRSVSGTEDAPFCSDYVFAALVPQPGRAASPGSFPFCPRILVCTSGREILGPQEGFRPCGCRDRTCSALVNAEFRETAEGWRLAKLSELGELSSGPGPRRRARSRNGAVLLVFRRTRPREETRWRQNRVGGYEVQKGSRGKPGARRNISPDQEQRMNKVATRDSPCSGMAGEPISGLAFLRWADSDEVRLDGLRDRES